MRTIIQKAVNRLLSPTGLEVRRKPEPSVPRELYRQAVQELHDCYCDKFFPEIPPVAGRVDLLAQLGGMTVTNGLYLLACLHRGLRQPGDICEFGIAQGTTSALMANELKTLDRRLWLFDSFQGLSRPTERDKLTHDVLSLGSMEAYEGTMAFPQEEVRSRLRAVGFPANRVEIVPGFIEETITGPRLPARVCFAFIDFDLYAPIKLALEFLVKVMPSGGVIMVHDYGHLSSGAKTAVDEFVASCVEFSLKLPPEYSFGYAMLERK